MGGKLLVSLPVLQAHGEEIKRLLAPRRATAIAVFEDRLEAGGDNADIEAAFLSTDMMGTNSNPEINLRLGAFLKLVQVAPNLRWLQLCSAGADRPVFRELMARGVDVTTASGANAIEVAHTALAAMMAFAREVPLWIDAKQRRQWVPQRDELAPADLQAAHAVVVGLGPIGQAIGRLCQAFGMRVTGIRRQAAPTPGCDAVLTLDQLPATLREADYLFLACPLTPETRHLVDDRMLACLPRRARLINVARGAVVDEAALDAALRAGTLAGAYSDVFATEPLPQESPLWTAPNFMLSAHSAGSSTGFPLRTVRMFLDNLDRWARGQPLLHPALRS